MEKSVESVFIKGLSRVVSSAKPHRHKTTQPVSPNRVTTPRTTKQDLTVKVESPKKMEPIDCRTPLAKVVADCAKRWFQDTLKEAKGGDSTMQVLVGQMYYSGYGVPRDPQKVFFCFVYTFQLYCRLQTLIIRSRILVILCYKVCL
ncbi:hypothetical protein KIW84_053838 [Lathyrus oleraceus]|uniref:Uncharacterized protein n=1 Tax=Pisum sativum TaxID=3888 RepID=A0A9D5AJC2_PEA|nr:hypothetical protein KIW84_053838 [Pisum sativum]